MEPATDTSWAPSFGIVDLQRGQLYVPRLWKTQAEAEAERRDLLLGFPESHEWWRRLQVVTWNERPAEVPPSSEQEGEGQAAA